MKLIKTEPIDLVFFIIIAGGIYLMEIYDKLDIIIKYPYIVLGFIYLSGRYIPLLSHKPGNKPDKNTLKQDN